MVRKIVILLIFFFNISIVFPQGVFNEATKGNEALTGENKPALNGTVRGILYSGAKNVDYASLFSELALKCRFSSGKTFITGDMRLREGLFFDERKTIFDLKEAYAGYISKKFDLFLGNQIITWGRTDGFNPTNNISPVDYFFLTPEPDDQKLANFMIRAKVRLNPSTELEIIGIPVYKSSVYQYSLFDMGAGASFRELILPEPVVKNATLAARFNAELPGAGFSLSWFHGFDPFYGFTLDSLSLYPSTVIKYRPAVYKKNTFGADFAIPVKTVILRGEMAVNLTKGSETKMYIPFSDFAWVAAIEHGFSGYTTIFQVIGKQVFNFNPLIRPELTDPANPLAQMAYASGLVYYESQLFNRRIFFQQKKSNYALFLSVNKQFAHDLLTLEMSGYYNLTSDEYFIRSAFKWNLSDALTATMGFSTMQGPDKTVFNKAGKVLNGFFTGLTASF